MKNVARFHDKRNEVMDALDKVGIATRPGTHCVHTLGFYKEKYGYKPGDYPNAYLAEQLTIALPLFAQMTRKQQKFVFSNIKGLKV